MSGTNVIDDALKNVTKILFNKDFSMMEEADWESEKTNDIVNLQLKKAWVNWMLGDVDTLIENYSKHQNGFMDTNTYNTYIEDKNNMGVLNREFLIGQSSEKLAYSLAYEIEPKLRLIKDVQRSLDKLKYFISKKNDPDYTRCAFNLNNTLQYLMSDVQPQLEQFLNVTELGNNLTNIEQTLAPNRPFGNSNNRMMSGGKRKRHRRKRRVSSTSRSVKQQSGGKRRKGRKGGKRRSSPVRRRSAKPMTKWSW